METGKQPHVAWTLSGDVAIVRFRYAPQRGFDQYEEIRNELSTVAEDERARAIVLNLDVFEHITSRFLGLLAELARQLSADGRRLALCRMRPTAERAFRISGLDRIISLHASEEDARAALAD